MPNGISTPSAMPPPCSMACCVIGMDPAAWQQARWPSRLPDLSSHCDDEVRPHGVSPRPPHALTTHIDMPTFLGTSPRLRRAGWAVMKAVQSHGMSPAMAPDPTARHQPCDALDTSNDVLVPSGMCPGVLNAGLTTPRWAETARMPPNGSVAPRGCTSSPDVPRRVWSPRHVV